VSLVGGLTMYNGSVLAEVVRAGVLAVPKGQSEAASAGSSRPADSGLRALGSPLFDSTWRFF
jgi:ABC-type amino acid transport system permease subunit